MESWQPTPNVTVNLNLTPEAAVILKQYAGERNRGRFVSELLVQQRKRDEREAQRLRDKAALDAQKVPRKSKKNRR
jgi:hypothetical protein